MRSFLFTILLSSCIGINGNAQVPPAIQWQKCYGGTASDGIRKMLPTPDGGYIMCGYSMSNDGDMGANYGITDALVMKIDASGNIQWRKNYGSTLSDEAVDIIATADGGYIFVGTAGAGDMDVTGYHPGVFAGFSDIWVVKINNNGSIQWQQCYGGPGNDLASNIIQATGGGYLVAGETKTSGGDIGALHGMKDIWIFRIDATGALQWQRLYGGTLNDGSPLIIPTTDGGYMLGCFANSHDGDISCTTVRDGVWLAKLDNGGGIQWQTCLTDDFADWLRMILQTTDGGYILVGDGWIWGTPPLPNQGEIDAYAIKLDAAGNIQWRHTLGGTNYERFSSVIQTPDGAYVMAGNTMSTDGDICINKGGQDFFIVKLNSDGTTNWVKTCGGLTSDYANDILPTPDGGYLVAGITDSNNGDVSGNHSNYTDGWLVKLSFPGVAIIPTINIVADKTTICPGESVTFVAAVTNAGDAPIYQWKVNGINTGPNNDTITISTLNNGDIVSCSLTSNSRCVTDPNAASNTIAITFSGVVFPAINIVADRTTICTGQSVTFVATITDGGNAPIYQWKVNGINTGLNNDTITISTLNNGDIVSCILTSNLSCVANPTASNTIAIAVDLSQSPVGRHCRTCHDISAIRRLNNRCETFLVCAAQSASPLQIAGSIQFHCNGLNLSNVWKRRCSHHIARTHENISAISCLPHHSDRKFNKKVVEAGLPLYAACIVELGQPEAIFHIAAVNIAIM